MQTQNTYQSNLLIPFHLADPAGILFFGHVFSLAHQVFEQFVISELECSWKDWFQNRDWVVPIKHAEADYHSPIHAGQECRFELSIDSIATTSFTVSTILIQEQTPCCAVRTIHVFCNPLTKQKIPIPSHLLQHLKRFK